MIERTALALLVSLSIAAVAIGCNDVTNDDSVAPASSEGKLTIVSASPSGVAGEYRRDARVVFFETIRTNDAVVHPDVLDADGKPSVTYDAVSLRFFDAQGQTVLSIDQGHGPEAWRIRGDAVTPRAHDDELALLEEAIPAIDALELPAAVAPEQSLLRVATHEIRAVRATAFDPLERDVPIQTNALPIDEQQSTTKCVPGAVRDGYPYPRIEVHRKDFAIIGEHTATKIGWWRTTRTCDPFGAWGPTRTEYLGGQVSCNHGDCPGASSMQYKCGGTGFGRSSVTTIERCTTYYNIAGGGGHVCNDDTDKQIALVMGGERTYDCARWLSVNKTSGCP